VWARERRGIRGVRSGKMMREGERSERRGLRG